ncbi:MAG: hypothetical protein AAGF19_03605 [Pseudomonadota bacterium]
MVSRLHRFMTTIAEKPVAGLLVLFAVGLLGPISWVLVGHLASMPEDPIAAFEAERRAALARLEQAREPSEAALTRNPAIATLRARAAAEPENGAVWLALGRALAEARAFEASVSAFERAIDVTARSADALAGYGEALVFAAGGEVGEEARAIFEEVDRVRPGDPTALYFLGFGAMQRGDPETAEGLFVRLARASPADAPWLQIVEARLRQVAIAQGKDPESVLTEAGLIEETPESDGRENEEPETDGPPPEGASDPVLEGDRPAP